MTKGIIEMNARWMKKNIGLIFIVVLFYGVSSIASAGLFNRGVILHKFDHTFSWGDADFDGIRNDVDPDDDNDGVPDKKDVFPFNAKESKDSDGDGIGDNADKDDDNDGVPDKKDAFPLDPSASKSFRYCLNQVLTPRAVNNKSTFKHFVRTDPRCGFSQKESDQSKVMPLGTDSDRDGVRDDVQKKIKAKFGKNTAVTNYTIGMAKSFQKVLSGSLSHKQVNQQVAQINHLNECIQNKTNDSGAGLQFILPEQLTTVARTRAYLKAAAEAYDKAGPPKVKPCGNQAGIARYIARTQGGGVLKSNSIARAKLNPPNLNGYDLFFINGVLNEKKEADETQEKLQQMLNQTTVDLEYNKNHMLGQFFDLWVHKVGETQVDKTGTLRFWLSVYYRVMYPDNLIYQTLADWLDPNRDIGHWAEKDLKRMIQTAKTALNQNKKVVMVAHSEGNFFYRNIYKALNQWDSKKTQQCFAGIGFATPLSSKPGNYDYITSSNDRVINVVRNFWNSTLAANITVPQGYGGDRLGHGMQKTYLSHPIPLRRLKTKLKEATNRLNKSCKIKEEKKKPPKKQPMPILSCSDPVGKGGGQGQHSYSYPVTNTEPHKVEISFEAYNVPDSISITANGKKIAQTNGLVGGYHQWKIDYDPKKHGQEFIAHVNAPYGSTLWKLCIDCEGSSCGGNIKRKKVSYNFFDSKYWKCDNYKIDGHKVNRYGQKYLSVGKHSFSAYCICEGWDRCKKHYGFPVISASGTSCSFSARNNKSCSLLTPDRVLEVK